MEITKDTAMLAKAGEPKAHWVMEPKWDGHRLLAQVEAGQTRMFARSGVEKSSKVPAVERMLAELPEGTVLDGEIVSLTTAGGEWSDVQKVMGADSVVSDSLTYVVFDILEFDGHDMRGLAQSERRGFLENVFERFGFEGMVQLSPQVPYSQEGVDAIMQTLSPEGVIVKDPAGKYKGGRSGTTWFKIKAMDTIDVVVMSETKLDGKGKFFGLIGALEFGQYKDGVLVNRGRCSGMNDRMREEFTSMLKTGTLAGTVIEIRHMGVHPTGGIKSPQFKRLRSPEKTAEQCDWCDR